jgi:polar amino acid transport system substrate-binding protein
MLRALTRQAGLGEVEFVHSDFGQLLHDLAMGRGDIVVSGARISPDRTPQVRFTKPFVRVSSAMLVPAGNPRGIHSLEDVAARPDAVLAVIDDSVVNADLKLTRLSPVCRFKTDTPPLHLHAR